MKLLRGLAALLFALLLLSCGGGGDLAVNGSGGGVGTGGTGIVAGTVTGLGSVVVEGVRYDERQAVLESRPDLVTSVPLALTELHIGQYAYLEFDAGGRPARVRVASQLVGPAAAIDAAAGRFAVWGQPVAINTDARSGPVTVFGGYGSLAEVQAGDPVQVYGVLQSAEGGAEVLRATRIERLAAVGALPARVTGTLQKGGNEDLLLAGRPLDFPRAAAPGTLVPGSVITAIVPWTATLPERWQATAVAQLAPAPTDSLQISGAVHLLAGERALVQGVEVELAQLSQGQRDAVREGSYLTFSGRSRGDDGRRLVASGVQALPEGGHDAQLRGTISALTGPASFVVRGQAVDASAAEFVGGTPASLAVGLYVEVDGAQAGSGVIARKVVLPSSPPESAVLEVRGTVQAVDAATRQVRVLGGDGRTTVLVLPSDLALPAVGQVVRAEGYWDGSTLQVRELKLEEGDGDHSGEGR